jgi:hypothetical protein
MESEVWGAPKVLSTGVDITKVIDSANNKNWERLTPNRRKVGDPFLVWSWAL